MAVNGRGGHLQTFDIRQKDQFNYVKCHEGPKFQKCAWMDDQTILTSGFDKQAKREYAVWDLRMFDKARVTGELGIGAGVAHL